MGDVDATTTGQGRSRWIVIGLVGSLMLNLLFVGSVAGRYWAHGGHWGHGHGRGSDIGRILRSVPEPRRGELRAMIQEDRKQLQTLREDVRRLRREAREVIGREPFDPASLRAAIDKVSASRARLRAQMADDFVELLSKMTAEERALYNAARRESRLHRGFRRGAEE